MNDEDLEKLAIATSFEWVHGQKIKPEEYKPLEKLGALDLLIFKALRTVRDSVVILTSEEELRKWAYGYDLSSQYGKQYPDYLATYNWLRSQMKTAAINPTVNKTVQRVSDEELNKKFDKMVLENSDLTITAFKIAWRAAEARILEGTK